MPRVRTLLFLFCFAAGSVLGAPARSGEIDLEELAQCIADSGAVFYGAHWCPYCKKQKAYFESYASLLPYVECYDAGKRKGMRSECREAGVKSFPTWHYPDGKVVTGARNPKTLARATGCL